MQGEFDVSDNDGVSGIRAAAIANNNIGLFRQNINHFAFTLITPL
jgi:hypothetical protein